MIRALSKFKGVGASYRLLVAIVALNALLVLGIILSNVGAVDLSLITLLYVVSAAIGYYTLPLLFVLSLLFPFMIPVRRAIPIVVATLSGALVYFLLVDSLTYRIVKFHIDPFWVEYVLRDADSLGIPLASFLGLLALLGAVVAAEVGIVTVSKKIRRRALVVVGFPIVAILTFTFSQIVHMVAYEKTDQSITTLTPRFPLYWPITSHRNAHKYVSLVPWVEGGKGNAGEKESIRYPLTELEFNDVARDELPNILVVMLESWRYDTMDEVVSPNMYALGQKSWVFTDHISSGNQTTCGVFGFFYGLHPTYWRVVKANASAIDNPVLIDVLSEKGYNFGIYADSNFGRHKIKQTVFRDIEIHEDFGRRKWEMDRELNRQLGAFITEQSENDAPFFAYAFYKSTHAPYEYPKEHEVFKGGKRLTTGFTRDHTDPEPHLIRYKNAVHYVDSLVGEIVALIDSLGEMDNTVIIITSDHGESFNDNGSNFWGHGSNFTQYQTHVPFILHAPGRGPRTVARRTTHVDFVPTILEEYFGCRSDIYSYSNGRNLFDEMVGPRPIPVGSYVSHAFIIGSDVYEILATHTRKYSLLDINDHAGQLDPEQIRFAMEEGNRFSDR